MSSVQAQSEKLLTWNLAVRDFHILVNLVKVCLHKLMTVNVLILTADHISVFYDFL